MAPGFTPGLFFLASYTQGAPKLSQHATPSTSQEAIGDTYSASRSACRSVYPASTGASGADSLGRMAVRAPKARRKPAGPSVPWWMLITAVCLSFGGQEVLGPDRRIARCPRSGENNSGEVSGLLRGCGGDFNAPQRLICFRPRKGELQGYIVGIRFVWGQKLAAIRADLRRCQCSKFINNSCSMATCRKHFLANISCCAFAPGSLRLDQYSYGAYHIFNWQVVKALK